VTLAPVFVTGRPEKAIEAARLGFRLERVDCDLVEPQEIDPARVVEAKAREAWRLLSRPVLVEDSGLSVDAWGGFPGALVKWLEKSAGVAAIPRMLDAFEGRGSAATCALAYFDGSRIIAATGTCRGTIAPAPRGGNGFGWDSIFIPEGGQLTFAEMEGEQKDRVSHRRRAWEALAARLPDSAILGR
jgi:XTP/dITP diphosphohydrolase